MSLFKKIFKRDAADVLHSYEDIDGAVSKALAGMSGSGNKVYVTEDTALSVTTVWACVSLLSESVGVLPIHLYKKNSSGRETVNEHPSLNLIRYPNAYTSQMD
ncbi:MAG: phage portal protein, partial [Bacteroidales bacterium]|nr:phage portal protein [Bacteroidales bacterium]